MRLNLLSDALAAVERHEHTVHYRVLWTHEEVDDLGKSFGLRSCLEEGAAHQHDGEILAQFRPARLDVLHLEAGPQVALLEVVLVFDVTIKHGHPLLHKRFHVFLFADILTDVLDFSCSENSDLSRIFFAVLEI